MNVGTSRRRPPSEMEIIETELYEIESALRTRTLDNLDSIARLILDRAEKQRKAIGAAYAADNAIRRCEKVGVKAIEKGDIQLFERCRANFYKLWKILGNCDLPLDEAWIHDGQAGQELVEFFGVCEFYPLLFSDNNSRSDLTRQCREVLAKLWQTIGDSGTDGELLKEDEFEKEEKDKIHKITVRYQTFLRGLCDVPGELQKLVRNLTIKEDLLEDNLRDVASGMTLVECRMLIRRHLAIITAIHEFVDKFELCYGKVINDSRMRGFHNTYRGALRSVVMAVDVASRWLQELKFKLG